MKTKTLYVVALTFLFAVVALPLYAATEYPTPEAGWSFKAAPKDVKTIEGTLTGEIICLYDWTTDQAYQGSDSVCAHPRHNQRSLVTEEGDVYLMVPDEEASSFVVKALTTNVAEKEVVSVKGTIVEGGPIKIVKVKSLVIK